MKGVAASGAEARVAIVGEVVNYVRPHVVPERMRFLVASILSFGAAIWGSIAALLTAAVLQVLREGVVPARQISFSWSALLDLNTMGEQVSGFALSLLGGPRDTPSAVLMLGIALFIATALAVVTNIASRWQWTSIRTAVMTRMQADLLTHLLGLSMAFHVRNRIGASLSRLRDVADVAYMIPVLFHTLLRSPLIFAGALLLMIRTSVLLTAVTVVAAAVFVGATFFLGRLVRQSLISQSRARATLMSLAQEALLSIRIVKSFGAEGYETAAMRRELDALIREENRSDLFSAFLPAGINQLFSVGAAVIIAIAGLRLVASGDLSEQGLVLFLITAIAMLGSSGLIATSVITLYGLSASAGRVLELSRIRADLEDGPREAMGFTKTLAMRGVTFGYGDKIVLRDVSLTIKPGEFIGIVGPSGVGKSTLADLLLRLYDPVAGCVELDGVDVRQFIQASYRRLFGAVSQETLLFHDTVWKNITYGRDDVREADVIAAAKAANAHGFITELPNGYDTVIGERGTTLSGGQRQRIAIARAMLGRPPILIFDEATSALDSEAERVVQEAIDQVIRGCTAIVIAHRMSTICGADRIVVLDGGTVVDIGTHHDLLERPGIYRTLYAATERWPARRSEASGAIGL